MEHSADTYVTGCAGCSGRVVPGPSGPAVEFAVVHLEKAHSTPRPTFSRDRSCAFQWLQAGAVEAPYQPDSDSVLVFSGPLPRPLPVEEFRHLARAATGVPDPARLGRLLRRLPAELSGCVVTPERAVVFRGLCSPDQVFFRSGPDGVVFSSDPRDLFDGRLPEFDRELLWRSCRGEDVLVYPDLGRLHRGQYAVLSPHTVAHRETFERAEPLDLPRRTPLPAYAELTYALLREETQHWAGAGRERVGILLSGGVDSAVVLAALADLGADVIAYHLTTDDPAADESGYARAVCRRLGVPLVTIPRAADGGRDGEDYFPTLRNLPHPYNHVWLRSLERVADRVAADDVRVLLSGLEGDMLFGPLRYGLHDVLTGDIRRREKARMLHGLLGTRWELRRLLRSARPSYSLYADEEAHAETGRGCDFLTPLPGVPPEAYDLDFAPQEHTLNLALWRPRGILLAKPLGGRSLRRLAARLPDAYRLIPYGGRTVDKPVLRLAAADRLPPQVWRHYGRTWLGSPDEQWCLRHPDALARVLGAPGARLVARGVVDPRRLAEVLADPRALRRNAENLLCSAMVELFLRDLESTLSPGHPAGTAEPR